MSYTSGGVNTNTEYDSYFRVEWSQNSQSIENNRTNISWSCWVYCGHSFYSNAIRMSAVSINGTTVYGGGTYSNFDPGWHQLASGTLNISHASDGTGSVRIGGFTGWLYSSHNYSSGGGTFDLKTIPRVSDISVSYSRVAAGGTQKVTTTKKSSSFTDTIEVKLNNTYKMNVSSGVNFTIPLTWLNGIPNSSTATVTATVTTKSGSTVIGSKSVTFTMTCPQYDLTASMAVSPQGTPAVFESLNYVQSLSKAKVDITATGVYGSTIASISTTIEGKVYNGASVQSDVLNGYGNITITTTVKDSRGITKTISDSISVTAYNLPIITKLSARADSGTARGVITISGEIVPAGNLNGKTLRITYDDGETTGTVLTETLEDYVFDIVRYHDNIDSTKTYLYIIKIEDSINSAEYREVTGIPCISRHAGGDGVTFGAEAEQAGFHCEWNVATFKNGSGVSTDLLDLIYPVGSIYLCVHDASPATIFGGRWEKMSGGYLYGAKTTIGNTTYTGTTVQSHKLITSEIPSHSHDYAITTKSGTPQRSFAQWAWGFTSYVQVNPAQTYLASSPTSTGGNGGHTHNLAYMAVWVWKRIA